RVRVRVRVRRVADQLDHCLNRNRSLPWLPPTRPFDTDTDSDPDLASPLTFSDDLGLEHRPYPPQLTSSKTPPRLCASARGSPDGNGEVRSGKRLPFRTDLNRP